MNPVVAIVAPGNMGAAVGARLVASGLQVLTSLEGRTAVSRERAVSAGMRPVSDAQLAEARIVLSIVPPAAAIAFARRLAPWLRATHRKPAFVDCNAVSPATVQRIAQLIEQTQVPFIDAAIIGAPPRPGEKGPSFYASGPHAVQLQSLAEHGLDIHVLEAPIGAASALKMSYAGITKGLVAVASTMLLAATRSGIADALRAELAQSQRSLLELLRRVVPASFPKAYRWVAEMQEVAEFAGEDDAASELFRGVAALYARLAEDFEGQGHETAQLEQLLSDR